MAGGGDANALPERDVSQWAQLVRRHPASPCLRRPARPKAPRPRRTSPRHGIGRRPHSARKLDKRCALRAVGAPRFHLVRFRWSEVVCGQGRGRTADLPLFRRTLVPTELPDLGDVALGATSAVLTGFEPATSTLTGWRALHAALQDHVLSPTLADDAPRGVTQEVPPTPGRAYHRN